jgi:GT2 family glycosyltransferase
MQQFDQSLMQYFARAYRLLLNEGLWACLRRVPKAIRKIASSKSPSKTYDYWISQYEILNPATRQSLQADIARLAMAPAICIIMLVSADDALAAEETIRSVQRQIYPRWQLCVAVESSVSETLFKNFHALAQQDDKIRIVAVEDSSPWADRANAALKLASGDFIALIDPGDALTECALYWVTKELVACPDADLIFSDEDKINRVVAHWDPWFKPDWNPALMLSRNAFGRLGVFRRSMLEKVGGFRTGYNGAEEYELVLRCSRATELNRIRHIARVLYHRRDDTMNRSAHIENCDAARRAVAEHLAIQNIAAEVHADSNGNRVTYAVPTPRPEVSILIPTTARPDILEPCLQSLFQRTSYGNWQVTLAINERARELPERAALLNEVRKKPNLRIIEYSDRPFNFSWINNFAAAQASSPILCFLNDDTKVITPDWLEQLIARVSLPQVAAAAPTLFYPDGTIQHIGVVLGLSGIAGHPYHHQPRGTPGYFGRVASEQDVSCVTAACMVIRAEAFKKVGGFDEAMPLAYNDVDLCLRLRAAGWRIVWTPAAELTHHESASIGRHDAGTTAEQYQRDVALMRQRWGNALNADPFYNCNLSLEREYTLAFPPRMRVSDNLRRASAA